MQNKWALSKQEELSKTCFLISFSSLICENILCINIESNWFLAFTDVLYIQKHLELKLTTCVQQNIQKHTK